MFVPARYTSDINAEHFAIRTSAGLTDMTGIHKVFLSGIEAFEFLNHTVTKDLSTVKPGNAVYTILLNKIGKVIDDAIVFHLDDQAKTVFKAEWLICLGAGLGLEYIQKQTQKQNLNIHYGDNIVCLLLQGPRANTITLPLLTFLDSDAPQRFEHKLAKFDSYARTFGRNEDKDDYRVYGAYFASKTKLTDDLNLTLSGRYDKLTFIGENSYSPRAGLVWQASPRHSVRLTYNKTYTPADALTLFSDLPVGGSGSEFDIWLLGWSLGCSLDCDQIGTSSSCSC